MFFLIRRSLKVVKLLVALLVIYLVVTFVQVVAASRGDETATADAIVVFGAAQYDGRPSPVLRARLDHAADLYKRDVAPVVVVTGGKAPGDSTTEASASANYLIREKKVPDSDIRREVQGRDSWQSLASTAAFLRREGRTRVVLVSDPFHAKRIKSMADELKLEAQVSPTRTSPIAGANEGQYFVRETVAVAAGRVFGFGRLVGIDRQVGRVRDRVESR